MSDIDLLDGRELDEAIEQLIERETGVQRLIATPNRFHDNLGAAMSLLIPFRNVSVRFWSESI